MKNRFIKSIMTTALAFIIGLTSIPVYAETDSTASTDYQNVTEAGEYTATVYATKASNYTISIPKTIILDGQTGIGEYQISLNGDIDSNVTISVTPDASFTMSEQSGSEIEATVVQDKTEWTQSDSSVNANGTITAELSAGSWTGSFKFNVAVSEASLAPGLYETGTTNMTKSWQELLDEGILVVTDGVLDHGGVTTYAPEVSDNPINDIMVGDLVIDKTVTEIATEAFKGCENLISVTIPNSVTSISHQAFTNCYALTNVVIPDSVESIGLYAFEHTSIADLSVPDSVTTIGDSAFYNVPNVNYNGTATGRPWAALAINGRSVISFTIDSTSYKAEEGMNWGEFVNSEYNNGLFRIQEGYLYFNGLGSPYEPLDIINNQQTYYFGSGAAN